MPGMRGVKPLPKVQRKRLSRSYMARANAPVGKIEEDGSYRTASGRVFDPDTRTYRAPIRRPAPAPRAHFGGKGNVTRGGGRDPIPGLVGGAVGFLGNAVGGAADFVRAAAPMPQRPTRVSRAGHEVSRQVAEQSGMAALDRIRRGDVRRDDVLLLASMGVAFTPAGAAARGGMAGRMLSLPRGGYSGSLIQGQLGDIMRILAEARQRDRVARRR